MAELKLEVPAELRQLAEKTIDQAEKAFGLFFDAARRSSSAPSSRVLGASARILATEPEGRLRTRSKGRIERQH